MADKFPMDPLKEKLLELLATDEDETAISKDAILDLLNANPNKSLNVSKKRQVHFNADLQEQLEDDDTDEDAPDVLTPTVWKGLPSLPTTRTIRYIDTNVGAKSGFSGRTPTEETVSEVDEYRFMDNEDEDSISIDGDIPYLNWTNYALSHLKVDDEDVLQYYSNKDLFIVLSDYLFIYSKPGNKRGVPWDYNDKKELSIIGILNKYELILIDTKQRDYTTECYVKCLLPLAGWVYLPQRVINKWMKSDEQCLHAMNLRSDQVINGDDDDESISVTLKGSNYHRIDMEYIENLKTGQIVNDNSYLWKQLDYLEDVDHDNDDINFRAQRIVPLVHPLDKSVVTETEIIADDDGVDAKEDEANRDKEDEEKETKLKRLINWIVRWMRAHPFFPGLAIVVIQAGIECVIFFDIVTDVIVVYQLARVTSSDSHYFLLSLFFILSVVFLVSPYIIGWVSILQFMLRHFYKKLSEFQRLDENEKNERKYAHYTLNVMFILFNILPFGVFALFIGDIVHLLEYLIIRPIGYLSSCLDCKWCKCCSLKCKLRNISFEELGYWKLRRVSEIYAETIPQSVLQLLLLLLLSSEHARDALDLSIFTVVLALLSSVIVTLFWIAILLFESSANGMSFVEYMTVVFQGSFKFVPYLPAIERGTKTGINVNWTRYRLDAEGAGLFAKALQSTHCKLRRLKISLYSIKNLHRNACKYFGSSCRDKFELIISREENDIKHLFHIYDIDDNWNFDFAEFARCCIVMRKDVQKSVNLYTVSSLFWELVATEAKQEIYLLDLLIKMGSSKNKIPLLDYDNTLHFATKNKHKNLIALLIGYDYHRFRPYEFEQCVIYSVIHDDYERYALALCEERGVPIVVEIISAKLKQSCNPSVVVSIGDIELTSDTLYNTERPIWHRNNKLLFIVPFAQIDKIMHKKDVQIDKNGRSIPPQLVPDTKKALNETEKTIVNETEKQIELVVGNKKNKEAETPPAEEEILKQIENLAENDDIDDIFRERLRKNTPAKPADIKLQMETNKEREKEEIKAKHRRYDTPAREYNETLFKINTAAIQKQKRRRNSLSATHSLNARLLTLTPIGAGYDDDDDDGDDDDGGGDHENGGDAAQDNKHIKEKLVKLWTKRNLFSKSMDEQKQKRLIIYVKLNDNKLNDEIDEEIIGGCKIKIDVAQNIFQFHCRTISQTLHHTDNNRKRFVSVGKLKMRIYLNVLHKYDACGGLKYIDN